MIAGRLRTRVGSCHVVKLLGQRSSSPSTPLLVTGTFAMICSLCWAGNNKIT